MADFTKCLMEALDNISSVSWEVGEMLRLENSGKMLWRDGHGKKTENSKTETEWGRCCRWNLVWGGKARARLAISVQVTVIRVRCKLRDRRWAWKSKMEHRVGGCEHHWSMEFSMSEEAMLKQERDVLNLNSYSIWFSVGRWLLLASVFQAVKY